MVSLSPQFAVSNAANSQVSTHVANLFDGRQVVTWVDLGTSGSTIRYKVYNADGSVAMTGGIVNPLQSGTGLVGIAQGGDYLSVTGLPNGGFVVAWQYRLTPTSDDDIFYRVYDANGVPGAMTRAHNGPSGYTIGDQKNPDVAWLDNGFVIAWEDTGVAGASSAIQYETFNFAGASGGTARADSGTGGNGTPDVASLSDSVVFVWDDDSSPKGVFGTEFGGIGPFRADGSNAAGDHDVLDPSSAYGWNASFTGADFMTVWVQRIAPTTQYEIRASFNGDGANSFRVNTTDIDLTTASPSVVSLSNGGWLVVWSDGGSDFIGGTDFDVVGQLYDVNHNAIGGEFVITDSAVVNNSIVNIDAAALPDGRVLVTWDAGGPSTSGSDVYGRYVDPRTGPVNIAGGPNNDQYVGTLFADAFNGGAGRDIVYWSDVPSSSISSIVHNPDGSTSVTVLNSNSVFETDTFTNVEALRFNNGTQISLKVVTPYAFPHSDGSSVLFRNPTTGELGFWSNISGTHGWVPLGTSSTAYSIVGTGDFTRDGTTDILFRNNATGDTGYYKLDNLNPLPVSWVSLGGSSVAYNVVGIGDFTGDGTADILWRNNTNGDTGYYKMDSGSAQWLSIGGSSPAYAVVGTGDFNGDTVSDILFRNNSTGDTGYYRMGGATPVWVSIGASSTAYTVVGTGDYTGDGKSDILWRNNSTGAIGMHKMDSGTPQWASLGGSSAAYSVVASGFYDTNATSDILFRNNATGQVGYYVTTPASGAPVTWVSIGISSTAYQVV